MVRLTIHSDPLARLWRALCAGQAQRLQTPMYLWCDWTGRENCLGLLRVRLEEGPAPLDTGSNQEIPDPDAG